MPVERKAWSCKWKCGRYVVLSREAVARHEKNCYHNPATRSCVTCRHFDHRDIDPGDGLFLHVRGPAVCTVNGIFEHNFVKRPKN